MDNPNKKVKYSDTSFNNTKYINNNLNKTKLKKTINETKILLIENKINLLYNEIYNIKFKINDIFKIFTKQNKNIREIKESIHCNLNTMSDNIKKIIDTSDIIIQNQYNISKILLNNDSNIINIPKNECNENYFI